jgi:hypothetical protein
LNVVVHALQQGFAVYKVSFVIAEDPRRNLVMPHQAMAYDEHVVLFTVGNILVGQCEIVGIRLKMNAIPLQSVLRRDGAELRLDDCITAAILARDLGGVDGRANDKTAPVGVFQRGGRLRGCSQSRGCHCGNCHESAIEHRWILLRNLSVIITERGSTPSV